MLQFRRNLCQRFSFSFALLFFFYIINPNALANPSGPAVTHGQADFSRSLPTELNIHNSPNAIINWQGFSIQAGELTRFIQQSAGSSVLNRVTGRNPSGIFGQLLSNGRVFLINPHGMVFGPEAVIDTAGFVASTLSITDKDFLEGRLKFEGDASSASIANHGYITAGKNGNIVLIAPNIENNGILHTDRGNLILAAGRSVTITSLDVKGVHFEVQAPGDRVVNLGQLIANDGAVGMFAGTLNHHGDIRADAVTVDQAGNVVLTASADITLGKDSLVSADGPSGGHVVIESQEGTTRVMGQVSAVGHRSTGGEVKIQGERVALLGDAQVDVSGETGGGRVLAGGDFQGKNPEVKNAKTTYIGKSVSIAADALSDGDGGEVIVWSDDTTRFYGSISARGGEEGGDGGFAEVSGKKNLDFTGRVDLTAPTGQAGTLLLDPENITVEDEEEETEADDEETNETVEEVAEESTIDEDIRTEDIEPAEAEESESVVGDEGESESVVISEEPGELEETVGVAEPEETEDEDDVDTENVSEAAKNEETLSLDELRAQVDEIEDPALLEMLEACENELGETELLALLMENGFDPDGDVDAEVLSELMETVVSDVEETLDSGSLLEILDDGTNVVLMSSGEIVFNDELNVHGTGDLTLQAGGNVQVASAVTLLGGSFTSSGADFINTAAISTGGGHVTLNHTGSVTIAATVQTGGGSFTSKGTGFNSESGSIYTGAGSAVLTHSGSVALGAMNIGGELDVIAGGDITQSGALTVAGASSFAISGLNLTELAESAEESETPADVEAVTELIEEDEVSEPLDDSVETEAGSEIEEAVVSLGRHIILDMTGNMLSGPVGLFTDTGDAVLKGGSELLELNDSVVTGGLEVTSTHDIVQTGNIVAGGLDMTAGENIVLDAAITTTSGGVDVRAEGNITLTGNSVIQATGEASSERFIRVSGGESGTVTVSGALDVSGNEPGSTGGTVQVTGEKIDLLGSAAINASGNIGGGNVRIGGDFQGRGDLPKAERTTVESGAEIHADALESGDAGSIVIWADETTAYRGHSSARALGNSGDGGFIEVSGKQTLHFAGTAATDAMDGTTGTLLLDPTDVHVGGGVVETISAAAIVGALAANQVIIHTDDSPAGTDPGHIYVHDAISYNSSNILTFLATDDIYFYNSVQNAGSGDLIAVAGWDINEFNPIAPWSSTDVPENPLTDATPITGNIDSYGNNSGSVFINTASGTTGVAVGSSGGTTTVAAYNLTMRASDTTHNADALLGYRGTATGDIDVHLMGDLTGTAGIGNRLSTYIQIGHGGNFDTNDHSGDITVDAQGNIVFGGTSALSTFQGNYRQIGHGGYFQSGDNSGDIDVSAGGNIEFYGDRREYSYAQIGHGGAGFGGAGDVANGSIDVVSTNGSLVFQAGSTSNRTRYVQIGHGGWTSTTSQTIASPITLSAVNGTTGILASNGSAQVGHGGYQSTGSNYSGDITVTTGDLDVKGLWEFAQIGHGGNQSDGNGTGAITIATHDIDAFGSFSGAYSQIGHGGYDADGNYSGLLDVSANNLEFRGGSATGAFSQLGHGGYDADGSHAGNIDLSVNDVLFRAGSHVSTYAQLGHGGYDADGSSSGTIDIMGQDLTFEGRGTSATTGANSGAYAQLGHGGGSASADHAGDIIVTGNNIAFSGGGSGTDGDQAYAQLGHGGPLVNGNLSGLIDVNANGVTFTGGPGLETYAQVGHGGFRTRGSNSMDISVNGSSINFSAGTGQRSYALIGHGGVNAGIDSPSTNSGDVTVTGNNVSVAAGTGNANTPASIGHMYAIGSASGDISVNVTTNLGLNGGTGANNRTVIGHGHYGSYSGDATGSIAVTSGNLEMTGGSSSNADVMIGHGGYPSATNPGNRTGSVDVRVSGETSLSDGSGVWYIGHRTSSGTINGPVLLLSEKLDNTAGLGATGFDIPLFFIDRFEDTSAGSDITIGSLGTGVFDINQAFNSATGNALHFLSKGDLSVMGTFDTGDTSITAFIAGWNGTTGISGVGTGTFNVSDIFNTPGSFGQSGGDLTVFMGSPIGGTTAPRSINLAGDTVNINDNLNVDGTTGDLIQVAAQSAVYLNGVTANAGTGLFRLTQGDLYVLGNMGNALIDATSVDIDAGYVEVSAMFGSAYVGNPSTPATTTIDIDTTACLNVLGSNSTPGQGAGIHTTIGGTQEYEIGGNMYVLGGSAANAPATIDPLLVDIIVAGYLNVFGGAGNNSFAHISAQNTKVNAGGAIDVRGGAGNDSYGLIAASTGPLNLTTGSTVTLTPGGGLDADALLEGGGGTGTANITTTSCVGCTLLGFNPFVPGGTTEAGIYAAVANIGAAGGETTTPETPVETTPQTTTLTLPETPADPAPTNGSTPGGDPPPVNGDTLPGGFTVEELNQDSSGQIATAVIILEDESGDGQGSVSIVVVGDAEPSGDEDEDKKKKGTLVCKCKKK